MAAMATPLLQDGQPAGDTSGSGSGSSSSAGVGPTIAMAQPNGGRHGLSPTAFGFGPNSEGKGERKERENGTHAHTGSAATDGRAHICVPRVVLICACL